jgi:hypothetical protein
VVKPASVHTVLTLALYHQLDCNNAFIHNTLTETF